MSYDAEGVVTFATLLSTSKVTITTARGDRLTGDATGQVNPGASGGEANSVLMVTVTGGTGRLRRATGTFTTTNYTVGTPVFDPPFISSGLETDVDGWITYRHHRR